MVKDAKPTITTMPPKETKQGIVSNVEKKNTKTGTPMLSLTIGEERISFFEPEDVNQNVVLGDNVTFNFTRKGDFLNGKGLVIVPKPTPQPVPSPQPQIQLKTSPAKPFLGTRPALHRLSATELEDLYNEESTAAKVEPARLGQISNQVRYARIEQSLGELKGLLRDILAMLQKSYLEKK